ncbi:DUF5054 domain-containing protein [Fictibacillus phosphorivorans]|uniref:DUF5054 domain-containing protein n=1 Tax=Fictibacillus phosphorivorans TaxID=1221500 RepID=UPI00203F6289|nr:DUF5054 domain-containing protein [Fictibacillus phosphorivorans]MCM3718866.1 DUF5054 domain-containing protein [Fictibacillus phosphorivorans]MCM3776488.1 DUF5054 domain-containing protein [Fictibacillus phosphorivorans]
MKDIEVVHVIFKTHLDIGFTDLAENVTEQYIKSYIPKAIELAERLDQEDTSVGFVWTTGSWLIQEYLKRANDEQKRVMEGAIKKGFITWHGLPFTTHTELMDADLLQYGLSISKSLDRTYGKRTISAKMTDVPGHTKAIVPHLANSGIQYLHIGVNPASKVPSVPSIFVWKGKDETEVIVNYADNYGDVLKLDGLNEVMVFAHTGDNCGPPSVEDIKREFHVLQEKFPNAVIKASTMDAFAAKIQAIKHTLPVVHEEIGDSWIHGVATDPKKVAQYRELLRLRNQWITEGELEVNSKEYRQFSDWLLLIPEHTWGLDEKKYLNDYKNYAKLDFQHARQKSAIEPDSVPAKYSYIGSFAMDEYDRLSKEVFLESAITRGYQLFEASWKEQRGYLQGAIDALSDKRQKKVWEAFQLLEPIKHEILSEQIQTNRSYSLGKFTIVFADDGSIKCLLDSKGKSWVNEQKRMGVFEYESFGVENYHRWFEEYVENVGQTYQWSEADQGKPGMELVTPRPRHERYHPSILSLSKTETATDDHVRVHLELPSKAVESFGAPKMVIIEYKFPKMDEQIEIALQWFDKEANRLPEAMWFSFGLEVDNPNIWKMDKLGEPISPLEVVKDGNRNLHALCSGLSYQGADGEAIIEPKDSPLVSPGKKRLLQFDNTFASLHGGFHFNLYNNVWGTNFPMWYEEDGKSRFIIKLKANS